MASPALQAFGSGMLESVAQVAVLAGTLVLLLVLVAFGAFVYKSVRGDGITWPDEKDAENPESEDGVRRGGNDDEWDFY
ncbi:hypothetical protein BRC83_03620 [Halobacteriales archaeon QS_1_68_17]|nr:MAG: hypothetical protein BRC83_03620 [Halobacteriales archaeon QS_1_68_17]